MTTCYNGIVAINNLYFNRDMMILSACLFILVIIYGTILLLYVLNKEFKAFSKNLYKRREAIDKTISEVMEINSIDDLKKISGSKLEAEIIPGSFWKKIINHDTIFYGLFVLALIFLFISVSFNTFCINFNTNFCKKIEIETIIRAK